MDKVGQTIDVLLTVQPDREAALPFLRQAICRHGLPETITIDGRDANAAATKSYNAAYRTGIAIRQVPYFHNMEEQDHRPVKRVVCPMLGFKTHEMAQRTLAGIELMHMLRKGQWAGGVEQGLTAAEQF